MTAISYSVSELWALGKEKIPASLISNTHLIYSSPATLAFNSPGAEGFGVKRAGLTIPGSVMLIVSPGCCGRNTSGISAIKGYENRFFYLTMDETDLVTGRHLKRIPGAVKELCDSLKEKPSVVMICITCVDALLGTDMERVCRRAEDKAGVRVRPCYMYALTREGRKPPMVNVRQSLYSLLEPRKKRASSVNLMGYFAPLVDECELYALLAQAGVRTVREISACEDFEGFLQMAEANFNLVLNQEARAAAQDLEERLGIPSIELTRLYEIDRIAKQYDALGAAIGCAFDYGCYREAAKKSMKAFRAAYPEAVFAIGEAMNGNPFELALAMVRYGFKVAEIYGTVTPDQFVYLRHLAQLSPDTRVFSNLSPSMLSYDQTQYGADVTITIGKDAGWYHGDVPCLQWGQDRQPYGFEGVRNLFDALLAVADGGDQAAYHSLIELGTKKEDVVEPAKTVSVSGLLRTAGMKGFRKYLTPFAPDQSGAVSALYSLGGAVVICDAGGCAGNVCGFDEPRWFETKSAVFSAGLRDMDAILGRDDKLVEKLSSAVDELKSPFAAIIGTPVPSVIGTDFLALKRMAHKKTGVDILSIDCNGLDLYDVGLQKTFLALVKTFAGKRAGEEVAGEFPQSKAGRIGVLGANKMDLTEESYVDALRAELTKEGAKEVLLYGIDGGLDALKMAGQVEKNLVVTVSGFEAARWMCEHFAIPFTCDNPAAESMLRYALERGRFGAGCDAIHSIFDQKKVLIVHEQVTANSLRTILLEAGAASVTAATWFMSKKELREEGDLLLKEEMDFAAAAREGDFDVILSDDVTFPILENYEGTWIGLPHFAVSGESGR